MNTLIKTLSLFLLLTWLGQSKLKGDDLPPPTANIISIPSGSWIIGMDNTTQGVSGVMNVRAYGLAVELLWNDVPLQWVIKSDKLAKDSIDMSPRARQITPTVGSYVRQHFRSGPLVIFPSDTAAARPILTAFNNKISGTTSDIKVYQTNQALNADVRYTIVHKPFLAIYDDGGNADIHEDVYKRAMIDTSRYRILDPGYIIDSSSCFTFASTPHWAVSSYGSSETTRLDNLKGFVLSGGNFLAQCEGIDAVENYPTVRYLTTNGVQTINIKCEYAAVCQLADAYQSAAWYVYPGRRFHLQLQTGHIFGMVCNVLSGCFLYERMLSVTAALDTVVQFSACKYGDVSKDRRKYGVFRWSLL
jgi:hypothetical protein